MNAKRIFQSFIFCTLLALFGSSAQAQSGNRGVAELKKQLLEQMAETARNSATEKFGESSGANIADALANERQVFAQGGILDVLEQQKKAIAGSFLADVKITAPTELAGDLKALIAFTEDGRFIGTLQGDNLPPINSPGIGAWTHQGGRAFAVTFRVVVYDTDGTLIGVAKVRGTCTLDESGNTWSGRFKYEVIAPNGSILLTTEGPWQATRIKVEPLN